VKSRNYSRESSSFVAFHSERNPYQRLVHSIDDAILELLYCPTCSRVYALDGAQVYLCSKDHKASTLGDGRLHRLKLTERIDSERSPWLIPEFVEEVELQGEGYLDNWIEGCRFPEDDSKNDVARHGNATRIGGRHLDRSQVISKFSRFVLQRVT